MSHLALRRVVIRLLHDPVFAASLVADPTRALAGIELSAQERAWLTATPPAAWRTDAGRPGRVLAALADEFPATLVLVPARAATFFAGPEFHAAVQERGSLAGAFADHLARDGDARVRAIARLEGAIAEVRRAGRRPGLPVGWVRLAPHATVVRVPVGAPALLAALRAGTRGGDLGSIEKAPGPSDHMLGPHQEAVLVVAQLGGGEATIEGLEAALAGLLECAAGGCPRAALVVEARRLGADAGEDEEIVAGLVADRLLVGEAASPVQ